MTVRLLTHSAIVPGVLVVLLVAAFLTGGRTHQGNQRLVVYAHPPCPPSLMEKYYDPIFAAFRRAHPEIELKVLRITRNYEQKIKVMFAGRVCPDVIFMYPQQLPAWAHLGALRDLDELAAADPAFRREDYFESMLKTFTYQDTLYGLPKDASAHLLYYNKDLFDRFGVSYPDETWDWDAFAQAAKQLTRDVGGDGKIDFFGCHGLNWMNLLHQAGGRVLSPDGRRCVLDSPEARTSFRFLWRLQKIDRVCPRPEDTQDFGPVDLFTMGKVAMWSDMYPAVSVCRPRCKFDWDIALLPRGPAGHASLPVGSAYGISTQCKSPELAWTFIKFITGRGGMSRLTDVELPSYVPVARSEQFYESPTPPANKQAAIDVLDHVVDSALSPHRAEIDFIINGELGKAYFRNLPYETLLPTLAKQVNDLLSREARLARGGG